MVVFGLDFLRLMANCEFWTGARCGAKGDWLMARKVAATAPLTSLASCIRKCFSGKEARCWIQGWFITWDVVRRLDGSRSSILRTRSLANDETVLQLPKRKMPQLNYWFTWRKRIVKAMKLLTRDEVVIGFLNSTQYFICGIAWAAGERCMPCQHRV